ncbi:hypothetical protein F4776DRAFT_662805 [Hypoxylon sp. NC0597]|nr:hypothetical protein F4776DRAFT_662805 [Hypoxylon sp. NC0597]
MAYQFPKTISAARIATFVSTAAWIQGTSASEVSLPEEALNNFLRRHRITKFSARQTTPPPPEEEEEEEDEGEEKEGEEESESDSESISGDGLEEDGVSSVSSPDSTPSEEDAPSIPADNSDPNQAGIAQGASGQPAIGSADPPPLSPGAKVAIGVWSAVAVIAIVVLIFFFCRRRRRARLAQEEMNALRDEELARSRQGMSEAGVGVPRESVMGPAPMEPAYVRGAEGGGSVRAPSGQWMPTPPWQDDPPTWRDSQPWRQSQPSVIAAPNGLPSGVRPPVPPMPPFAMRNSKQEFDRRTEVTAETESTIFAYR